MAPTWGDHTLLETCAIELVSILLKNGYQVVYRPHPMTVQSPAQVVGRTKPAF